LFHFAPENTDIQAETSEITLYGFANTPFSQYESFSNQLLSHIICVCFNINS